MTTYPALIPSSRVFTPGEYPATAFSGYSGAQGRVRHSNVFLAAQLRLSYIGLSEAQMLQIWGHYASQRGGFEPFALPVDVLSGSDISDYVPATYRWIYSGPGQVEDLPCGGHNVSLILETVPPVSASVIGAQLFISLRLSAGASSGGQYAPGISESMTLSLSAGNALAQIDGLFATLGLALATGTAIADTSVEGVSLAFGLILEPGNAVNAGVEGISETITLGLVAGAASEEGAEPNIGDAYGGGYFAGYISHTADGVATHRLIVAPAATGQWASGDTRWKTDTSATSGTGSGFDGVANTDAMVTAGINSHPAAKLCVDLATGGFSDWYLPSRDELQIAYVNLKPTTTNNTTGSGVNNYSVPKRTSNYTTTDPSQTSVTAFQSGEAEAFEAATYWSSTEGFSASLGVSVSFSNGTVGNQTKTGNFRVRAFRREAI